MIHEATYVGGPGELERAVRELAGFLVCAGVCPSHRFRITTVAAELCDNACVHAYDGARGPWTLRASCSESGLELEVRDHGLGFDPGLDSPDGGLARCRALSEELVLESSFDGTRVLARFALHPVVFENERHDFSEADFLTPENLRRLLETLERRDGEAPVVPPALAVTVGRLLCGRSPRRAARTRTARHGRLAS